MVSSNNSLVTFLGHLQVDISVMKEKLKSMGVSDEFQRFCHETSLHGWANVVNTRNFWMKIFWAIFLLACNSFVLYLCTIYTLEFLDSGTVPIVKTTTGDIKDITFPTLVICNINELQASFFQKMGLIENHEHAELFKSEFVAGRTKELSLEEETQLKKMKQKLVKHYSWNESTIVPTLLAPNCSNLILVALVENTPRLFPKVDHTITDYGICCYLDIYYYFNIKKGNVRSSVRNGLELVIDAETFDYFDDQIGSSGWRMWIGNGNEKPFINYAQVNIDTGKEVLLEVTPSILKTSQEALSRFSPEKRNCYTNEEFKLRHFDHDMYNYTIQNCLWGAVLDAIENECQCTSIFQGWADLSSKPQSNLCYGKAKACELEKLWAVMDRPLEVQSVGVDGKRRKCLPECQRQVSTLQLTSQSFPTWHNFKQRKTPCLTLKKINEICQQDHKAAIFEKTYNDILECHDVKKAHSSGICNKMGYFDVTQNQTKLLKGLFRYSRDNLAHLKIYIKDPFYTLTINEVQISIGSFIGNLGGLLGMLLGLSAFGAFELVVFLFHLFMTILRSLPYKL